MSEFTVVVVNQPVEVETTQEQNTVEVNPAQEANIDVSQQNTEINISETPIHLDIIQPEQIIIEISDAPVEGIDPETLNIPRLAVLKEYSETISALRLVTADSNTTVEKAEPSGLFEQSKVLGVTLNAGLAGFEGRIHILGVLEDPSFNYAVNELLYLGTDGQITNVPPSNTGEYSVTVGYSLGTGAIFIKIEEPILLS